MLLTFVLYRLYKLIKNIFSSIQPTTTFFLATEAGNTNEIYPERTGYQAYMPGMANGDLYP